MSEEPLVSPCPVCGAVQDLGSPRYRGRVCGDCESRAVEPGTGRRVAGFNTGFGGGFVAHYVDDVGRSTGEICAEVTDGHRVLIDGRPFRIDEARFGGVVVMPDASTAGEDPDGAAGA
ncbi:hypothetical protein K8Z61_11645 [Nocardioides sp. TRM66260-LWL]|uniref:hypothetical protein n=1 Tax=Nocardioides sp. TRM66260-LWL TaxID=2874478 RepID=UPI001CC3EC9A|nr:hypothetical protein [Nocardioides sp. TRM66260-LWL]MBZ5735148.1 hypothetical protein [Nocardioides sp. TRM66260-LWL]